MTDTTTPATVPAPASPNLANASAELSELFAALVQAQAKITSAPANSVGAAPGKEGLRQFKYADLSSVWDTCRGPLTAAGLAIIQRPEVRGAAVSVETVLAHQSGQWIRSVVTVQARDVGPQSVSSAITYARRSGLTALVGVATAEDDEPQATHSQSKGGQARQQTQQQAPQRGQQQRGHQSRQAQQQAQATDRRTTPPAGQPAHDPVTGEVIESQFEQLCASIDECRTVEQLDEWRQRKDLAVGELTVQQLENLRARHASAYAAVRGRSVP